MNPTKQIESHSHTVTHTTPEDKDFASDSDLETKFFMPSRWGIRMLFYNPIEDVAPVGL